MTRLFMVERALVKIETALLVLFLSSMIVLSFSQVVLRNLFDTGLLWADPTVRHLVLWVGFLGAAIATSEERHISIDALTRFLPPAVKRLVHVATNAFALVTCYLLADAAVGFFLLEKEGGGEIIQSIPSWVGVIVIPPGYALLAIHFAIRLIKSVVGMSGRSVEIV